MAFKLLLFCVFVFQVALINVRAEEDDEMGILVWDESVSHKRIPLDRFLRISSYMVYFKMF